MSRNHNWAIWALINAIILAAIYSVPEIYVPADYKFIAWDGFIDRENLRLTDINTYRSVSLEYIISIPDLYLHRLMSLFINREYIYRVITIYFEFAIICYIAFSRFKIEKRIDLILSSLLLQCLYFNIAFQWMLSNGVIYSIVQQTCYFLVILTIIASLESGLNIGRLIIITTFLSLLSLWSFSLVIVLGLFIAIYCCPQIILDFNKIKQDRVLSLYLSSVIFLLILLVFYFYQIAKISNYDIVYATIETSGDALKNGSFGSLWGGLYTQMAGLTDWSMYQNWDGRLFGQMNFYLDKKIPQIFVITLYIFLAWGFLSNIKNYRVYLLMLYILSCLFLIKGSQSPFGDVYLYLIGHFKAFESIRSPDSKFGIYIIACVLLLSIYMVKNKYNKAHKYLLIFMSFIYLSISIVPMITGETTHGNRDNDNYTYTINLSKDEKLLNIIKNYDVAGDFGLLIPGIGNILTPSGKIGFRDYLDYLNNHMYSFNKATQGPYGDMLIDGNFDSFLNWLNLKNIHYLVIRKSIISEQSINICFDCIQKDKNFLIKYEDKFTILYEYSNPLNVKDQFKSKAENVNNVITLYGNIILFITALIILISFILGFIRRNQ